MFQKLLLNKIKIQICFCPLLYINKKFLKKIAPSIKFNNDIQIARVLDKEFDQPFFQIYNKEGKIVETFDPSYLSEEQILEKIQIISDEKKTTQKKENA